MSGPTFDLFAPGAWATLALFAMRIGGIVLVAPVYSSRSLPLALKATILALLTALLLPAAAAHAAAEPRVTPATLLTESLIGVAMGFGAAVFVGGAELAGSLLAVQTGLSGANVVDPTTQHMLPVLSNFLNLFTVTMILAMDGHLVMLEAVMGSVDVVPIGGAVAVKAGLWEMVALGAHLFTLGLRFAAPVVAVLLVSNVALGILARATPQLNVLMAAFPVQIGVGLFTLAVAIPLIATFFTSWPASYAELVSDVLKALAGGP